MMTFLSEYKGYLALIIVAGLSLFFYGNSQKNSGRDEKQAEWLQRFAEAKPETTVVYDTLRMPPELLIRPGETKWIEKWLHDTVYCEAQVTLTDTLGGKHNITYQNHNISEIFVPGMYPITERFITRNVLVPANERNFVFGISAEYHDEVGLGLLLAKKPVYLYPKYYPESKTYGFGFGLMFDF